MVYEALTGRVPFELTRPDPETDPETLVGQIHGVPEGRDQRKSVEMATGTALWYHAGIPPVPIRWVLIRDPQGRFASQAILCTDQNADPVRILEWFVMRWPVEVTFHEVRTHLGIETQRQWSDLAILRTTPALLGLFSLVTIFAHSCWVSNPFLFVRLLGIPKPCQLFRTRWPSFVCSCGPPAFLLGPLFITRSSQSHGLSLTILWIRSPLPRDLDKV